MDWVNLITQPHGVTQLLIIIAIGVLIYMVFTGKVGQIGPGGIHFNKIESSVDKLIVQLNSTMKEAMEEINRSKLDRLELHKEVTTMAKQMDEIVENDHRQAKELLKTQIMLAESYEQKEYLFEQYKKMGGNGWMDTYMMRQKDAYTKRSTKG